MLQNQWFFKTSTENGAPLEPISEDQLIREILGGRITPDMFVYSPKQAVEKYYRVRQVPKLMEVWDQGVTLRRRMRANLASATHQYGHYSSVANRYKEFEDELVRFIFGLAFATTLVSVFWGFSVALVFAIPMTLLLGVAFFWLHPRRNWIAGRHAAEMLKSNMYLYACGTGKYVDPRLRDDVFEQEQLNIDAIFESKTGKRIEDFSAMHKGFRGGSWLPDKGFAFSRVEEQYTADEYHDCRLQDQLNGFYNQRVKRIGVALQLMYLAALVIWLASLVLPSFSTALLPLVTTAYGILIQHMILSAHVYLKTSYTSTARTLGKLDVRWTTHVVDNNSFRDHVEIVELILIDEHLGWLDRMESTIRDVKSLREWLGGLGKSIRMSGLFLQR